MGKVTVGIRPALAAFPWESVSKGSGAVAPANANASLCVLLGNVHLMVCLLRFQSEPAGKEIAQTISSLVRVANLCFNMP